MTHDDLQLPEAGHVREALRARRAAVRESWSGEGALGDALVLVPGGLPLEIEGTDQPYAFRAHDDHYYLGGCRSAGQVLVLDPVQGWTLYADVPSTDDLVWHGGAPDIEAEAARVGIEHVRPVEELGPWLAAEAGRPAALLGSRDLLERPKGYGLHPGHLEATAFDAGLSERLEARVHAARACKDGVELAYMRAAAACSAAGHEAAVRLAQAGMSERALQVEIEAAFGRSGAERTAYGSIVASGPNAAVLHATPGARALREGDLVLVDAGAEVAGYDSDVTRTWPVAATFTKSQRALYDVVLEVQKRAIERVAPGVEFRALHLEVCRDLAAGLVDFGLLRGDPDGLVERDAHALFFPHGLGHLLGLATHDVGGWAEGRTPSERPGLKYLRIDLPLRAGHVVTIEPGLYLVPVLLQDPVLRETYRADVNWELADAMTAWGGIRIEDDVLVTEQGREVLTAGIDKAPDALEARRA